MPRPDSLSRQLTEALEAIRDHAQHIADHREDEYWTGTYCEDAMVSEAENILTVVRGLLEGNRVAP